MTAGRYLRRIGWIDPAPLRASIDALDADFQTHTFRQDAPGSPHRDTETMFLRMTPLINRHTMFESLDCRDWPLMAVPQFRACVEQIAALAERKPARAMIVRLAPGGRITSHVDQGAYADATDRYHYAIDTNEHCMMHVGDEAAHAAAGDVWFFDKHAEHAVMNAGGTARVHLIVDVWRDPAFVYRPTITYQEESFSGAKDETAQLVQEHWEEINGDPAMPVDIDWEWFANAEDLDLVRALTVRADGVLVGYIVFLLMTLPHYRTTLVACDDAFFLKKEYRTGTVGVKMFSEAEKMLAQYGVRRIIYHEKLKVPMGRVFQFLRYRPVETIWWKDIPAPAVKVMPRPKLGRRVRPLKRITVTS